MSFEPANADGIRRELAQAEANVNHHLETVRTHQAEADRWGEVATNLRGVIELLESPAKRAATKNGTVNGQPLRRRPSVRWGKEWPGLFEMLLSEGNPRPTKKQLIERAQRYCCANEMAASQAVYSAIKKGDVLVKLDRCYLPSEPIPAEVQ